MFDVIFFVLVSLYMFVTVKVMEWQTLLVLGLKFDTPEIFLKHRRACDVAGPALFLCVIASLFAMTIVPWYVGIGIFCVALLCAVWVGRRKAFNIYRRGYHEMMDSAENDEERAEYEAETKRTDQELSDRVQRRRKYRI
jgi:hypothetical protein